MNKFMRHPFVVVLLLVPLAVPTLAQEPGDTVVLEVDGMWGEGCEEYIETTLLADVAGIETVIADAETGEVTIAFDANTTDPDTLARAVETCPQLDVTGSSTHELKIDDRPRQVCCESLCLIDDNLV